MLDTLAPEIEQIKQMVRNFCGKRSRASCTTNRRGRSYSATIN